MNIELIDKEDYQKEWNKFVIENSSPADFLQSWQWGEFRQKKLGEKILRLAIFDQKKIITTAQFIYQPLAFNKYYLFCPRGPLINNQYQFKNILLLIINEIKKIARQEKIIFIRFEPIKDNFNLLEQPKFLTHYKNPSTSLLLDLNFSEEEILKSMHPKWRYNIKLAEKRGVHIDYNQTDKTDFFYNLLEETAVRNNIKIFSKKYYQSLFNYFYHSTDLYNPIKIALFTAKYQNKILAAILVIGFGDTATYLHGGSSNEKKEFMPNHAIQWQAIRWAKKNGYKWYDFWGIAENNQKAIKKNPWAGLSHFKQGFVNQKTGKKIDYPACSDYIINKKWYALFSLAKKIKF